MKYFKMADHGGRFEGKRLFCWPQNDKSSKTRNNWNELVLSWQAIRYDEHYTLRMSGHNYATLVKSGLHANTVKLSKRVESVQRRATTWILNYNHGELTYQQRLICLDLLPLCYEREISDLVFFFYFMASQIWTWITLSPFPTMVGPDFVKILRSPLKFPSVNQTHSKHPTSTELLKKWNYICKVQHPSTFCSLSTFKRNIRNTYKNLLGAVYI